MPGNASSMLAVSLVCVRMRAIASAARPEPVSEGKGCGIFSHTLTSGVCSVCSASAGEMVVKQLATTTAILLSFTIRAQATNGKARIIKIH